MNAHQKLRLASLPLTLVLLAGSALGQSEAKISEDMDFARALASRFSYVDLAEKVMNGLEKAKLDEKQASALGLLKCDVYAAGAKSEPSAEKRLELYDKAIAAFEEYMKDNPYSELLPKAQRNYVDLVNNYGRVLEIRLDEVVGDEAAAVREKIRTAIEGGLQLTGDLIDQLAGQLTQVEKLERWRLMLNRGQMLLTLANVSEDGTWYYSQAEQVLENLALEAGETSGPGLNAYVLLARVQMAQSAYTDAATFAEFVVDVVMPIGKEDREVRWNDLSFEEKTQRWKLAELATGTLVDAYTALGKADQACKWALHYYNSWRVEGFDISPLGYLSLLSCARALLDSGGYVGGVITQGDLKWFESEEAMKAAGYSGNRNARSALDLALSIAQTVNDANRGNTLQVRAQKVISDITSRPGVTVSPDILYEAAQGEYYANNYAQALEAFKGILAQLDSRDEATRQEYAPKVLFHMGSSLERMERPLEAAMAYREAATRWAGDPEFQPKVAQGYYRTIREVKSGAGNDPILENMYREAENLAVNAMEDQGDASTIVFRQAERAYGEEDYAGAREKYLQIEKGANDYEKALVKAALCLYKMKDEDGAEREFQAYVEHYVPDPANAITGQVKQQRRKEALAQATYYLGLIAYKRQDWDAVIQRLYGYHEKFENQTEYGPNALYMVVLAELAKKDLEAAKAVVQSMVENFPTHVRTGTGAGRVYDALKQEQEAAEKAGDSERATSLKEQMAEYLHLSNELSSDPSFANIRTESKLWLELEKWEEARQALVRLQTKFGDDPDEKDDLQTHVLPDLGLALLELKRVPEAFEVLDPLVPKDDSDQRKPKAETVRRWCRAVAGWVEGDARNVVEVPGIGGTDNLKVAADMLLKLTQLEDASGAGDWTCPWFELKFEMAYTYYQWGKEDSTRTKVAFDVIKNLRDWLGDPSMARVAEECGNDVLQRRFLWLWDKVQ